MSDTDADASRNGVRMTEQASAWTRFWNRGGLWRAPLLAALSLGICLLLGFVIGRRVSTRRAGSIFVLLPALSTYLVIVTGLVLLIVLIVSEGRRQSAREASAVTAT